MQNVIAHWIPKFIVDAMQDLITDETGEMSLRDGKSHTLTYKDSNSVIAPAIASHLESYYSMKPRSVDDHAQNSFGQYRQLIEQEIQNDGLRDFLSISKHPLSKEYHDIFEHHFKSVLHASSYVIRERVKVQMKCFCLFPNLKEQQKSVRSPFTVS